MTVQHDQRFSRERRCPVCGGAETDPPGRGVRCWGYLSGDGAYAHCVRDDRAGELEPGPDGAYAHRLGGACRCGSSHGGDTPAPSREPIPLKRDPFAQPARWVRPVTQPDIPIATPVDPATLPQFGEGVTLLAHAYEDDRGYRDALHVRAVAPDGRKKVVWCLPDGTLSGGEAGSVQVNGLLPYPGASLLGLVLADWPHDWIVWGEGEKVVDALIARGIPAICYGGGAHQRAFLVPTALKRYTWLGLPDHDAEGRALIDHGRAFFARHGVLVQRLDLPGLREKGDDAHDWFERDGHTREEFLDLAAAAVRALRARKRLR